MELLGSFLSKTDKRPLYEQLYTWLVDELRAGRLQPGEKLPGKRSAAAQLGISVNTVDAAYQMLAAEGYVDARARSGFVVASGVRGWTVPAMRPSLVGVKDTGEGKGRDEADASGNWRYSFSTSDIDTGFFPRKTWNRLLREVLSQEEGLFSRGEAAGDGILRRALAGYLRGYRGVRCDAGQIVCGAGLEVLLGLLAPLLGERPVAVEDPGYPGTAKVLANAGRAILPLAVDAAGMVPARLWASGAGAAYLTPSHQFPTGAVMPVTRREELLRWADETPGGGVLIEDDYDSEFRFDGRPLPSLQGLDEHGRVVYAGTFSRSLAPGIRAAYLVLPPALLERWQAAYGGYACTVSRPEQHTLARLLDGGYFARGLNRMRVAYRRRRGLLLDALAARLEPGSYTVQNAHTGLYCILRLPGRDADTVVQRARAAGLRVRALDSYFAGGEEAARAAGAQDALVLGYGGLPDAAMDPAVAQLAAAIEKTG